MTPLLGKKGLASFMVLCLALSLPLTIGVSRVKAAPLSFAVMRPDRMAAGVNPVKFLLIFKTSPSGAITATEGSVRVTFDAAYTFDTTQANWSVTVTGVPTTYKSAGSDVAVTNLPGTLAVTGSASNQVTFTFTGALASSTTYGVYLQNSNVALLNPDVSEAGNQIYNTIETLESAAPVDSTQIATRVIADDQVVVTATVSPTFSFSLSGNTDTFGTLSTSAATASTGYSVQAGTNGAQGYTIWVKDLNAGLTSATTGQTIAAFGTPADGTPSTMPGSGDAYLLSNISPPTSGGGDSSTGTPTIGAEFVGNGTSTGGTLSTSFQLLGYSNGTSNPDTFNLKELAQVTSLRAPATDYTDTLTFVGAGNF
jgi:hypothetical protein